MLRYTGKSGKGTIAAPMEYDGLEVMLVKFESGAIGKVSSNYDVVMPYNFTWEVFGNKGTCKNNEVWSNVLSGQNDWVTIPGVMLDTADVVHHAFTDIVATLVDSIRFEKDTHANLGRCRQHSRGGSGSNNLSERRTPSQTDSQVSNHKSSKFSLCI